MNIPNNNVESESPSNNQSTTQPVAALLEMAPQLTPTELPLNEQHKSINEELLKRRALREELKCSICFDLFRQPVSLPGCGHTFCRVCIEAYMHHSPPPTERIGAGSAEEAAFVHCPLCRTPSCITRTGSEWHLIVNRIAANMVERLNGTYS